MTDNMRRKNLLLHVCCAPCSTYPITVLREDYDVTAYFYNPNIHPKREWKMRRDELTRFLERWDIPLIIEEYDAARWFRLIRGFEDEPEGGNRCEICFDMRLKKTAEFAARRGFDIFTTTLSVSPHKNAQLINKLGMDASGEFGVEFYQANFKKKNGFKISVEISRKEGLYRQNFCGCIYSQWETEERKKMRANND
ncbi:epoxyqueuosine reductase QueH [bacterium]|nr:epoxyqueuosine reductase QueH [bacterium]